MRRREFITLLGGTAAAWLLPSRAQQRKAMPRVGVLWHAANAKQEEEYLGALTNAFHELGYVEGKNIELDHRFPAEQPERFRTCLSLIVADPLWRLGKHQYSTPLAAISWVLIYGSCYR